MSESEIKNPWKPFDNLIKPDETPLYGWRILTYLDNEGQTSVKWISAGDPDIDTAIGVLERVQFLMQAHEWDMNKDDFDPEDGEEDDTDA